MKKTISSRWPIVGVSALSLALLTMGLLSGAAKDDVPSAAEIPSRVILTWAADPAHTQHVTWRTDAALPVAKAEIAPLSADPAFVKDAKPVEGIASRVALPGGKTAGQYSVEFTGLNPGAEYSYRVGNGRAWSEWNVFRTAQSEAAPFRFLYIGDAQNGIRSVWSRAIRIAYQKAPDARFVAMAGDLLAEGYDDQLWGELCDGFGFISATMPLLPVPGNHDEHTPDQKQTFRTSQLWRLHFGLPHNGPKGVDELDQQAYYMDYQGVRFISLDANPFEKTGSTDPNRVRIRDAEVSWLESVLKINPNQWTVVIQHQDVYSIAHGRDYPEMQSMLAPLYEKYKVAMVLQGHDHSYGRVRKNGVAYVISVSGAKMYELESKHLPIMEKTASHMQMYQVVDVNAERMALRAYAIDGRLVDSFEVTQRR